MTPEEAYRILELEAGATPERVQEAYRKAALETHPDRAQGYGLHDRKRWLQVRDAYECLRAAGFPELLPAPEASKKPAEAKRYQAPDWLQQRWSAQSSERIAEHFRLDEHETRALTRTIGWIVVSVVSIYALFHFGRGWRPSRQLEPKPGLTIRW